MLRRGSSGIKTFRVVFSSIILSSPRVSAPPPVRYIPLESVAIYVPGSSASYPSSVLMNAIPAIVAGVKRIIMINPGFKGRQNPAVLYAARKCKIKEIYSIGGPSAIAALTYGTKKNK